LAIFCTLGIDILLNLLDGTICLSVFLRPLPSEIFTDDADPEPAGTINFVKIKGQRKKLNIIGNNFRINDHRDIRLVAKFPC
jgi:hypothetical protein